MSETPPPPDLGRTQHPGLAAAMAADKDAHTRLTMGRVVSELLYGYVIMDSAAAPDGTPGFFLTQAADGRTGVTVYTSNEVFADARPDAAARGVSAIVIPAPEALRFVANSNMEFLMLDSGYSLMRLEKSTVVAALNGPFHVRLRSALALPPADVHAAVLEVLAHPEPEEPLIIALYPESVPENGDLTHAVPMTSTNAEGNKVMLVFTSFTEALLATEARYTAQTVAGALRIAAHPSIGGILLNPGTSTEVVLRDELAAIGALG